MTDFKISVLTNLSTKSRHVVHSAGLVATHLTYVMTTSNGSVWQVVKGHSFEDHPQYPRQPHSVWSVSHLIAFSETS